jgi:hypothetical protein
MVVGDHVEIKPSFSLFNKFTEHPYEPIPNVFLINPPEMEQQD